MRYNYFILDTFHPVTLYCILNVLFHKFNEMKSSSDSVQWLQARFVKVETRGFLLNVYGHPSSAAPYRVSPQPDACVSTDQPTHCHTFGASGVTMAGYTVSYLAMQWNTKVTLVEMHIHGRVIKFVECGFIASYYKVFTYNYADPHRPSK
jgi:hypothetical protein